MRFFFKEILGDILIENSGRILKKMKEWRNKITNDITPRKQYFRRKILKLKEFLQKKIEIDSRGNLNVYDRNTVIPRYSVFFFGKVHLVLEKNSLGKFSYWRNLLILLYEIPKKSTEGLLKESREIISINS